MEKRSLGNTGLEVSLLGYGCGGYWGYPVFNETQAIRLVHEAIDLGVNFFDTGASYSGGNAEPRLGKALKGRDCSKLIIGSKVGTVIREGRLCKDFSPASMVDQVDESLRNLNLDSLPILQLHSPSLEDLNDDTFGVLQDLREKGKIKLIGASCDGAVLEKALQFEALDVVMMTYNLIEQHAIRQLNLAHERGCGILVKSPLCHTLYSSDIFKVRRLSDLWYLLRVLKNYRSQLREGFRYRFVNDFEEWGGDEIALLFALHTNVSCVVMGTTRVDNLKRNIETVSRTLPAELRATIEARGRIS